MCKCIQGALYTKHLHYVITSALFHLQNDVPQLTGQSNQLYVKFVTTQTLDSEAKFIASYTSAEQGGGTFRQPLIPLNIGKQWSPSLTQLAYYNKTLILHINRAILKKVLSFFLLIPLQINKKAMHLTKITKVFLLFAHDKEKICKLYQNDMLVSHDRSVCGS